SPPVAIPIEVSDSARVRLRSNQRTISVLSVRKPDKPAPTAITKNDATSWTGLRIWLNQTKPAVITTAPNRITRRDPNRWSAQPWIGPSRPLSGAVERVGDRDRGLAPAELLAQDDGVLAERLQDQGALQRQDHRSG